MAYKVPFVNFPLHYQRLESEIDAAIKDALSKSDLIIQDQLRELKKTLLLFAG